MNRLFFIALFSVILSIGSAGSAQAELNRKVNCDAGQSLAQALEASDGYGGTLTITLRGTCEESVTIDRDRVRIVGEDGATIIGRVLVFGPTNVDLRNLAITGPDEGVRIRGGRARIIGCSISENEGVGVVVVDGAWVIVRDSDISDNAALGILTETAQVQMRGGRVAGNAEGGIRADRQGSIVLLGDAVVEDNPQSGIQLWLHSTLDLTEQSRVADNWDLDIYAVEDSAIRVSSGEVSVTGVIACDDYESSFRIVEGAEDADIDLSQVYCTDFN